MKDSAGSYEIEPATIHWAGNDVAPTQFKIRSVHLD
jgi:hypothetical protein